MSVILLAMMTLLAQACARHLEGPAAEGQQNNSCIIPGQLERGSCQQAVSCAAYQKSLADSDSWSSVDRAEFLKKIQCGVKRDGSEVCCPVAGGSYQVLLAQEEEYQDNVCGFQAPQFKILGGAITEIDEFPWTALLFSNNRISRKPHYYCGGVLISRTFVITAAHCISSKSRRDAGDTDTVMVRLREYNILSDLDCVIHSGFADCADSKLDYKARKLIPHPGFDVSSGNRRHDIGLILIDPVPAYSDFLRPICLTDTLPAESAAKALNKLTVAGWGNTDFFQSSLGSGVFSPVKLKVALPYVSFDHCREQYRAFGVELAPSQLCAGGRPSQDACSGDSGNPLMHYNRKQGIWVLIGLASFGLQNCGGVGVPGVYTNVREYTTWIKNVTTADSNRAIFG